MAGTKATTLTLRIDPAIKEGLRAVAAQEHRSLPLKRIWTVAAQEE